MNARFYHATILFRLALPVLFAPVLPGCAIHCYDADTGIEHLIGFGHLKLKHPAPGDSVRAIVVGTESAGISVGTLGDAQYLGLGLHRREQIMLYDDDVALSLDRPLGGGLFTAVIGSGLPDATEDSGPQNSVRADGGDVQASPAAEAIAK